MDTQKKIIEAVPFGVTLEHEFFSHVSDAEKLEISKEIMCDTSFIFAIAENNKYVCAAVYSFTGDKIHVREFGCSPYAGKRGIKYVDDLAVMMAKMKKLRAVSFCSKNVAFIARIDMYGYSPIAQNEFEKVV